ncbi:Aspartyl/asparaginyl beta-hydroxylase, partial [Struthio camelus australis]
ETKHGGSKNGKKEGLSGSSFFTWFMVIALLGVWTSVAVVWFELIDYEEVLAKAKDFRYNLSEVLQGKLGIYDADGDGDFDVEDAKVLLGKYKHRFSSSWLHVRIWASMLVLLLFLYFIHFFHQAGYTLPNYFLNKLISGMYVHNLFPFYNISAQSTSPESEETIQPAEQPFVESELEEEIQSVLHEALHSQSDVTIRKGVIVSYEYDMGVENTVSEPEAPGDAEPMLEDAIEHHAGEMQLNFHFSSPSYVGGKMNREPLHRPWLQKNLYMLLMQMIIEIPKRIYTNSLYNRFPNHFMFCTKKKKKPKLLNKFDKTIKAELDAAEKLRKKGKVEEALRAFEALVNQYPQSPRARYGKAQSEDDLAEKMRSNEMLQQAINTYDEVASLPNVPPDLMKLSLKREADRQQFLGRMRGSLVTLQKLVHLFPSDTSFKNDLGVGYLLIGDNSNAKKVYEEVLSLAPNDGFAKVHYGFILKAENKIAESIPYLKEGLESGDPGTNDGRFYFHLGDALQRIGDKEAYKWYELGYQRGHFASVWQRSLYNVKGLKAQPWWTARETGYTELVKSLEKNWKLIRDEGLTVMDKKRTLFLPEDENLREKGDWSQFTLWQQGRKNENACKGAPKTCALLERFPEATGCRRGQIKYSVMHPGTHVWPHTGPTNCRLRMHLGLVIPKEGCRIRCAQENRTWEEGKVLIFDDSFEHEVWQDAESYRLIFIVDVWHPELTAQQRRTLPAI